MRRLILLALGIPLLAIGQSVSIGGTVNGGGTFNIGTFTVTPPTAACAGYALDIPVTLSKASGGDLTNFPVRVAGRDFRLASSANGGNVQNSTTNSIGRTAPADLIFATTTSTATTLKHETVFWDATTGDFEFWVQQPTYHSASNDTIHICVNNASVTTSQDDLSLWADVNYVAVYHYPQPASGTTSDLKNSVTGTAATATNVVNYNFGSTGSGPYLDATGNVTPNYIVVADTPALRPTNVTLESYNWALQYHTNPLISHPFNNSPSGPAPSYRLGTSQCVGCNPQITTDMTIGGIVKSVGGSSTIPYANWYAAAATYDGSNVNLYFQGVLDGTTSASGTIGYSGSADLGICVHSPYATFASFDYCVGMVDESRIASDGKSANWIASGAKVGDPYRTSSTLGFSTYTKPIPIQRTGCAVDNPASSTAGCVMNFTVDSDARGGVMLVILGQLGTASTYCPAGLVTDSLGLTYTPQATSLAAGHVETYSGCMYTAPFGTGVSGADTITVNSNSGTNVNAEVYEIRAATVTGLAATQLTAQDPPTTMTASCSTSNCILFCATTSLVNNSAAISETVSPSSYRLEESPGTEDLVDAPDKHPLFSHIAWGWVGSGSQSCSFGGGWQAAGGTMVILPYAP